MKLAFLWPEMTSYADACLRATASLGHDLYVAHRAPSVQAPYDDHQFGAFEFGYRYVDRPDETRLTQDLAEFVHDAIIAVSWHRPAFRAVLRRWKGRSVRVLFMDNPWRGTPKQWLGRMAARLHVRPYFDAAFLPGERQAVFARMLGFADHEIWWGPTSRTPPYSTAVAARACPNRPRSCSQRGSIHRKASTTLPQMAVVG